MLKPIQVWALPQYRLYLKYADGIEGEVDLSHMAGKGVFALWNEAGRFEDVSIGPSGEIRWGEQIDLCPDALYLMITGQPPEAVFPNIGQRSNA